MPTHAIQLGQHKEFTENHNTTAIAGGNIAAMKPNDKRLRGRAAVERRKRWLSVHPLCEVCTKLGLVKEAEEVDHIVPLFKGGADDVSNMASLCKEHHAEKTRIDLGWKPLLACDPNGLPIDPNHHWNQ